MGENGRYRKEEREDLKGRRREGEMEFEGEREKENKYIER